jgi:ribosomal protein S18 acetylase RimI-like enzyme
MVREEEMFSIQPLSMATTEAMVRVHNEGFGSKICCLCFPVADMDGRIRRFYEKHPERLPMCGVAVGRDGTPLGYVQLAIHPMNDKDGLHTTKPGETYIEQISVSAEARGKGIGKLLLEWAEARAREHKSTVVTLSVLSGNPARRLYERFGFEAIPVDGCEECVNCCVVSLLVGRPYGACDPHWGVVDMRKTLVSAAPVTGA